jgi:hypothetical protein
VVEIILFAGCFMKSGKLSIIGITVPTLRQMSTRLSLLIVGRFENRIPSASASRV